MTTIPVLYIIVRNDLASMNPGKAIAQGSHAANAFVYEFHAISQNTNTNPKNAAGECLNQCFYQWEHATTQGFGTVLVLQSDMESIRSTVSTFKTKNYLADVIHDPTYPIRDGIVTHHIPLDTCGYVFVPDRYNDLEAKEILGKFEMY